MPRRNEDNALNRGEWIAYVIGLATILLTVVGSAVGVTVFYFQNNAALEEKIAGHIEGVRVELSAKQDATQAELNRNVGRFTTQINSLTTITKKFDETRESNALVLQDVKKRVERIEAKLDTKQ